MNSMLARIAKELGAAEARYDEHVQSLWSGYGEIARIALVDGPAPSVIVKRVHPPALDADASPRDRRSDDRKRRSYDVEAAFYRDYAARCDATCRVAQCHATRIQPDEWLFVLEDLDAAGFSERHHEANGADLDACLSWLASFHARFLVDTHALAPTTEVASGLWPIGTYWHLATRTDELATIADAALRAAAPRIDAQLSAARYQTILHGDPKDANFCFTSDGTSVAAVDFQYAGLGPAMKDLAYFLYGRADEPADGIAADHLDTYFRHFRAAVARIDASTHVGRSSSAASHVGPRIGDDRTTRVGHRLADDRTTSHVGLRIDVDEVEREWRSLYPIARLDFCRFLAGWAPSQWRADRRGQRFVDRVLRSM